MSAGRWVATGPDGDMDSRATCEEQARLLARSYAVLFGVGRLVTFNAGDPWGARVVEVWHGDRERGPVLAEVYP